MGEKQSKGYWQDDEAVTECNGCGRAFTTTLRRHHCRNCGYVFCGDCSRHRAAIPMRGITDPERVCDACNLALRNSHLAGSTLTRSGPAMLPPNPSETPDRGQSVASAVGTAGAGSSSSNNNNAAAVSPNLTDSATRPAAAAAAVDAANPALTEEQKKTEEYYQSLYGGAAAMAAATQQETVSPEALERERLIQRWNTVRQATVYIDILVQQSERVEPTTAAEYSRETEALTLEPELPPNELSVRMLPMPRPCTDSARYLLEPVKTLGMPAATLGRAIAGLTQRLMVQIPPNSVKTASPVEFTGY
ncbi:hypothetical protein N2W54_008073 [Lotmaria passim]